MTENEQEPQVTTDQMPGSAQPGTKTCKFCAEEIKAAARICRFCDRDQEDELPRMPAEQSITKHNAADEVAATTVPTSERKCSFCREDIKRDAIICSHCGKNLAPKSTGAAYLFLLFLGGIGAHRFYLMQRGAGLFFLSCFLFSFLTFGLTMIPAVILGFVDLFTLPAQVNACNKKLLGCIDGESGDTGATASSSPLLLAVMFLLLIGILGYNAWQRFAPTSAIEQNTTTSQSAPDDSATQSPEQPDTSHSSAATESTTFPVDVTVTRNHDLNEYQCHYDRIKIVSQIGQSTPRTAPDGSVYLVLFYDVKPMSKRGSSSALLRTEMFEIVTSDKIEYLPDQDALSALSYDKSILSNGEGTESWKTEFQPGIEKKLATVFQIPVEQLAKDPVLIVPESYGMAKRIPLDSIAKAYGGGANTEVSRAPAESSQSPSNEDAPDNSSQASDLVSQMIQNVQSNNQSFEAAFSSLRALPKPRAGDSQKAEAANPIGLKALKEKDYSKAVSEFLEAVQADPSTARYMSNLGFAEMYTGDLGMAEKHTIRSIALAPDRRVAWNNLGQIRAKQDKQDDAIACFLIAYKLSKGDSLVYLKSLHADDDQKIREAGRLTLEKLGQISSTGAKADAFSDQ